MTDERILRAQKETSVLTVFIERPIFTSVISLLIVIAGCAALFGVEVRELPDVDRPVVSIRTAYPGATPEAIDAEVTAILEGAIAQVSGIANISSNSSFAQSNISVEFLGSVNIDVAATDIKNAVSAATRELPEGVEEPVVIKADSDASPIMRLAISTSTVSDADLARLVDDIIVPRVQSIEGVALADPYGVRNQVIRVRVFPVSLAARGYAVSDVTALLRTVNSSAASGRLRSDNQEILIRTETRATSPEEVGNLQLDPRTRLKDVAFVEWGYEDATTTARVDGKPGIGVSITRQAQANTVLVADRVKSTVEALNRDLPTGVEVMVTTDDSIFINRAIEEVLSSLLIATGIVIAVIFLFLGTARATLIPAITIPISLMGTVAALWLAGFSVNLLTLLALVMAAGLVVDDAIVVTENVQRWRGKGAGKRAAAVIGSREIVFAVISTTLTLAAVFIPISFLPGDAGQLFSEFGFVLAFAVGVSSFVALTLCPMLTVAVGQDSVSSSGGFGPVAPIGRAASSAYRAVLGFFFRMPFVPVLASLVFAGGAWALYQNLPRELTPTEDRGRVFMRLGVQEGANFEYLDAKVLEIEDRLRAFVGEDAPADSIISINGLGGSARSFVVLRLKDWGDRKTSQQELEGEARRILGSIPGVNGFIFGGNSLGIRGGGQGLGFAVAGDDFVSAAGAAEALAGALEGRPEFDNVRLNFDTSQPQVLVEIDREAAGSLGVPINAITTTLAAMADEFRASEVFVGDDVIEIMVSSGGEAVNDPGDLANLFVRAGNGAMIPLSAVADIREEAVASSLSREGRRRVVPLTAGVVEGVKLSDAIEIVRQAARETLTGQQSIILLGEAKLLEESGQSTNLVYFFAALIVFLVLAAQFESVVSALIIMVTVPFGLAAAVYAIALTGGSLNYYSQIGLVLLIGIMAKNGILIVEFANQLRDRGYGVGEAIKRASDIRLRPVCMTAISTLLGGLPLILGAGAGAESRASLGWVIFGGLGFATVFTLFLTPVAYRLLAPLSKPRASAAEKLKTELDAAAAIQ